MNQILTIIILILLILQLGTIFFLSRLVGNLVNKINTMNGLQFNTLSVGSPSPLFRVHDESGNKIIIEKVFSKGMTLLLFANSECMTCKRVLSELDNSLKPFKLQIVVINTDETSDDSELKKVLPSNAYYIRSSSIASSYGILEVPYAVIVGRDGNVDYHSSVKKTDTIYNFFNEAKRIS